jgi:hypothetical protein
MLNIIRTKSFPTVLLTAVIILSYTTANLNFSLTQLVHNIYHVVEHVLHVEHRHELIPDEIQHTHLITQLHSHSHPYTQHDHHHHHVVDKLLENAENDADHEEEHTNNRPDIRLTDHLNPGILTSTRMILPIQRVIFTSLLFFTEWDRQPVTPPPKHLSDRCFIFSNVDLI